MADDTITKINKLPEAIQDFILDPEGIELLDKIFNEEKIDKQDQRVVIKMINQVLLKDLSPGDFVPALQNGLPSLSKEILRRAALKIVQHRFLPLEDYLGGGVEELIKSLGGSDENLQEKRVEVKTISAHEAAAEIYLDSGLKVEEPTVAKRIQDLIELRLREVRDDFETAAALVRGKKVGGADLTEDDTKKILENIKVKMLGVQIVAEEQENREIPKSRRTVGTGTPAEGLGAEKQRNRETEEQRNTETEKQPPFSPPVSPEAKQGEIPPEADPPGAEEGVPPETPVRPISQISPAEEVKPPAEVQPPKIDQIIPKKIKEVIVADLSRRPASPELQRGKSLAEAEEEREIGYIKKVVEKKMGKIAAPTSIAEAISRIVKSSGISEGDPSAVAKLKNIITSRLRDIRDKSETLEMLMRHPRLGGFGLPKDAAIKLNEIIDTEFTLLHEQKREEVISKTKEIENKVKETRTLKARDAQEKEEKESNERWMKMTRKQVLPKETPVPKILPAEKSAAPPSPREVEDIRPREILVGPIEELGKMTLGDFRKLALKPNEAILKIKSKIDLLATEDVSKKIAGIVAWKSSEMMKIYFDILRESIMRGKPVAQIIKDKETAKLPILNEEEFKAIVGLNRVLKI